MPTYEYQCQTCQNRYEKFQRMTDEPDKVCEECGGPVRRLIFPAGVIFKGSGFYATDSRKAETTASSTDGASSEAPAAEKAEKAESKPAADAATTSKPAKEPAASAA